MKKIWMAVAAVGLLLALAWWTKQKLEEKTQNDLRAELMTVHDEVMPKMGELTMLAGRVKEMLRDSSMGAEVRTELESLLVRMESAEEGMMDWMAAFKQPEALRSSMDHPAIMTYLQQEKTTISQVASHINEGIEQGKYWVDKPGTN